MRRKFLKRRSRYQNKRMQISPLPRTHQTYIYTLRNSYWKQMRVTEKLLYNQGYKKVPHGVGSKGREATRLGSMPLRGDTGDEGTYVSFEILSGEWVIWTTYWVPQPWGQTLWGWVPLADLKTSATNSEAIRNLHFTCEEYTHTWKEKEMEEADRNYPRLWAISQNSLSTYPNLNWVPTLAPLAPQHSSTLKWSLP